MTSDFNSVMMTSTEGSDVSCTGDIRGNAMLFFAWGFTTSRSISPRHINNTNSLIDTTNLINHTVLCMCLCICTFVQVHVLACSNVWETEIGILNVVCNDLSKSNLGQIDILNIIINNIQGDILQLLYSVVVTKLFRGIL